MVTLSHFTAQQKLHTNCAKKEFKPTNAPSVAIFLLILFVWFCIIIKALNDDTKTSNFFRLIIGLRMEQLYPRLSWKSSVCTIISALVAIIYTFVLSQSKGKFIIYFSLFFVSSLGSFILFISVHAIIIACLIPYDGVSNYMLITLFFICSLLIVTCLVLTVYCTVNVETEAIFEIIRDSCRALRSCPFIVIVASTISALIILILTFTVYITRRLILSNCSESAFWFYFVFNLYSITGVINFFTNFTQIVISGYVTDWIWSNDPNLGSWTIQRNFGKTLRFHMGTVTFFSIPLLPHIWSIYHIYRNQDTDSNIVKQYNFLTRFISQLRVFMSVVDFSMIQTSIYGYDSTTAIKAAHDLVSQNNHEINLAVCLVSDIAVGFGSFLISIPSILENTYFCIYVLIIPFYILLTITFRTLLVNKMVNNSSSEASQKDLYNEHDFCTMNTEHHILYFG